MQKQIIDSTIAAMKAIRNIRFYKTERGYHGRFYCKLQSALEERDVLINDLILEIEYQKNNTHNTRQRPDIILHVPVEVSFANVRENNYAVWALKRHAIMDEALDDFRKLNIMFETLKYPLGIFINIESHQHCLEHYPGPFHERIVAFAVKLCEKGMSIIMAYWENDSFVEIRL